MAFNALTLIVLVLQLVGHARADYDGCGKPIRLDDPGRPFHGLPVLHQGYTYYQDHLQHTHYDVPLHLNETCWAYAAVQLAEGWRRGHAPASTFDEKAFLASPEKMVAALGKGRNYVENALRYLTENHNCADFAMAIKFAEIGGFRSIEDIHQKILYLKSLTFEKAPSVKFLQPLWAAWNKTVRKAEFSEVDEACHTLKANGVKLPGHPLVDLGLLTETEQILAYLSNADLNQFVSTVCPTVSDYELPVLGHKYASFDGGVGSVINKALDAPNPQAVVVGFCAKFLTSARFYPRQVQFYWSDDGSEITGASCDDGSDHYALVIGRRANPKTGHCEFLIRNSLGASCDRYLNSPAPWECKNGQIWVGIEALEQNAKDVVWFEDAF